MAGPVPMMLGPFGFEALGFGFSEMSRKLDVPWAELPTAQNFDAIQFTGPKSDISIIKGVLFPQELGGAASLQGIAALAEAGQPMMLVSGDMIGGDVFGLYVATSVEEDKSFYTAWGAARRDAYQITIRRYPGAPTFGSILSQLRGLFG